MWFYFFADHSLPLHLRSVLWWCAVLREWTQEWFEKFNAFSELSILPYGIPLEYKGSSACMPPFSLILLGVRICRIIMDMSVQQAFSFPKENVFYSVHGLIAPVSFMKVCREKNYIHRYSSCIGPLDMNSRNNNKNPFSWFKCLKKQKLELDDCVLK